MSAVSSRVGYEVQELIPAKYLRDLCRRVEVASRAYAYIPWRRGRARLHALRPYALLRMYTSASRRARVINNYAQEVERRMMEVPRMEE